MYSRGLMAILTQTRLCWQCLVLHQWGKHTDPNGIEIPLAISISVHATGSTLWNAPIARPLKSSNSLFWVSPRTRPSCRRRPSIYSAFPSADDLQCCGRSLIFPSSLERLWALLWNDCLSMLISIFSDSLPHVEAGDHLSHVCQAKTKKNAQHRMCFEFSHMCFGVCAVLYFARSVHLSLSLSWCSHVEKQNCRGIWQSDRVAMACTWLRSRADDRLATETKKRRKVTLACIEITAMVRGFLLFWVLPPRKPHC